MAPDLKEGTAVRQALARLREARSRDECDDRSAELGAAAQLDPSEVIDLYQAAESEDDAFSLVWCLHGLKTKPVLDLYQEALKHEDSYVRWAAIEGPKHSRDPALIPAFLGALRDRAHLVKSVAVEWLEAHGDSRALVPPEHLIERPSLIRNSPGIVEHAKKAVSRIRVKATGPTAPRGT